MEMGNINQILAIVRACDAVILATCAYDAPDARHVTNIMNRDTDDLKLYFMTSHDTPKVSQLESNNQCCLYYFDDKTRHAVRLYGTMEFVSDADIRRAHWRPEFEKFGYGGPDNPNFVLMRFVPNKYKYYVGEQQITGNL
ncbi:pyridoxamine 5'-phosphate oxidase family protein [bacterium]|nr:pyridoxamine 5'-phosphate oxidase family protein [bacterium]